MIKSVKRRMLDFTKTLSMLIDLLKECVYNIQKFLRYDIRNFFKMAKNLKETNIKLGFYHLHNDNISDAALRFKIVEMFFNEDYRHLIHNHEVSYKFLQEKFFYCNRKNEIDLNEIKCLFHNAYKVLEITGSVISQNFVKSIINNFSHQCDLIAYSRDNFNITEDCTGLYSNINFGNIEKLIVNSDKDYNIVFIPYLIDYTPNLTLFLRALSYYDSLIVLESSTASKPKQRGLKKIRVADDLCDKIAKCGFRIKFSKKYKSKILIVMQKT